jgi:hypothetical protein
VQVLDASIRGLPGVIAAALLIPAVIEDHH